MTAATLQYSMPHCDYTGALSIVVWEAIIALLSSCRLMTKAMWSIHSGWLLFPFSEDMLGTEVTVMSKLRQK